MGVLQRFERRLEALVQGAFTRAFGGWVEPVEVAAALTREAEDRKTIVAAGRVLVPNSYTVELGPSDSDRLREYDEPLRVELAAMVGEAAQEHGWSFVGPIEVRLLEVHDLDTGAFRVRSAVVQGELPAVPAEEPHLEGQHGRHALSGTTVLGRGEDVDLQLNDTGISRRHAQIDGDTVKDLGSTNGTWVNGSRITTATLHDGDVLRLGTTELTYRMGG